ncbi:MFS transporter [Actinocorallia sp. B10E7]|uniref:MFS transporter n=1 Tax=Actinocorallia sp. B10E7 TaxID=3153558 RepID=UPI00325CF23D
MLSEILSRLNPADKEIEWQQSFAYLWSGSVISQLGTTTAAVASPLLALTLSGSAVFAGWVAVAGTLPGVLLQLPAGFLVDRIRRRRRLMALSQAIRLLSALIFSISLFCSDVPHIFLLVAVTINGACTTVYSLAEVTSVRRMVPEKERNSAAAQDEARGHISQVAGRSLGGYIFGIHHALPYVFEAVTSFMTLITLVSMGPIRRAEPLPDHHHRPQKFSYHQISEVWQEIRGDVYLRQVLAVCATANLLLQAVNLLLLVEARKAGYSSTEIGLLLASSGSFGILGSFVTAKWLTPEGENARRTTTIGFVVWAALMLFVYVSPSPALGLVFWGMFSAVGAYINIALRCHQTAEIAEERLGRVISIGKFVTGSATALGALIAGYAVDCMEPRRILTITATVMALTVVLVKRKSIHDKCRAATSAIRDGIRNTGKKNPRLPQTSPHRELEPAPKPMATGAGELPARLRREP